MWEYRTVRFAKENLWSQYLNSKKIEKKLNELGGEGWELVSINIQNGLFGMEISAIAILKRKNTIT